MRRVEVIRVREALGNEGVFKDFAAEEPNGAD
jgi:hypothetical protein